MKAETIQLLTERKTPLVASLEFANSRLDRLRGHGDTVGGNQNLIKEHAEFTYQKQRCEDQLTKIDNCITWLNSLENND